MSRGRWRSWRATTLGDGGRHGNAVRQSGRNLPAAASTLFWRPDQGDGDALQGPAGGHRRGRPVLGIPIANVPAKLGGSVLVAWDGGRAASRAMNDALPLLAGADAVTVLAIGPDGPARRQAEAATAHLRRHGVAATASRTPG